MMHTLNPLADDYAPHAADEDLVRLGVGGDAAALETLLNRHQNFLYLMLRSEMLYKREDAEDATQEVMLKLATRLSSFRGESSFRTWAYRIAANHILDRKRSAAERSVHDFDCYARYLDHAPDRNLPDDSGTSAETRLLVEGNQARLHDGLLLCLDRAQRIVFVLGEIFGTSDSLAGEVLGLSPANFRQKLARAREACRATMKHAHPAAPGSTQDREGCILSRFETTRFLPWSGVKGLNSIRPLSLCAGAARDLLEPPVQVSQLRVEWDTSCIDREIKCDQQSYAGYRKTRAAIKSLPLSCASNQANWFATVSF